MYTTTLSVPYPYRVDQLMRWMIGDWLDGFGSLMLTFLSSSIARLATPPPSPPCISIQISLRSRYPPLPSASFALSPKKEGRMVHCRSNMESVAALTSDYARLGLIIVTVLRGIE